MITEMSKPLISPAIKVGDLLFLSGMTGEGATTEEQSRNIFEKIKKVLEDNGSSLESVVAATVYLTDIEERPAEFNPVWREYFPDNPPTRTCVEIGLAGSTTVEVTVIAKAS
jgi:2-iminobutanoate/2-iminopropanoate deaminase